MLCRFEYDAPDYIPFEPALEIQKAVSTPRRPKDPFLYTLVCSWALFVPRDAMRSKTLSKKQGMRQVVLVSAIK
jgi:hypothetical protein